jgi:PAS domain S-box-containing protein
MDEATAADMYSDEERYRIVADYTYDWEYWLGPDGRLRYISPSCERITGYPPWEFIEDPSLIERIIVDKEADACRIHRDLVGYASSFREPAAYDADFRIRRRDGEIRWIAQTCRSIYREDGSFLGLRVSNRDNTERKRVENELRALAGELEKRVALRTAKSESAVRELESFAYSVSHDLRAPLRAINGFAEIIGKRYGKSLDPEARHYFNNIFRAGKRMDELIVGLLAYSRLGRGGMRRHPVDLSAVIATILRDEDGRIAETGAEIQVAPDLPCMLADQTLLAQIFSNLVGNALTYNKKGLPPRIDIRWREEGPNILVSVGDEGIGIPSESQDKIFEVFQRLHSVEEYPGTGIGLATVRKSAGLLGGSVLVESEPGIGSTFTVILPKE